MFQEINESIEVAALFRSRKIIPLKFLWQGKEYVIKKINLTYSSWIGRSKIYYFAVSDSANYFKLQFNSEELSWTLLESYTD